MLHIYIDSDREYTKAIASAKASNTEFVLMPKSAMPDKEATGVFASDADVLKQWTDIGVAEYVCDLPTGDEPVGDGSKKPAGKKPKDAG